MNDKKEEKPISYIKTDIIQLSSKKSTKKISSSEWIQDVSQYGYIMNSGDQLGYKLGFLGTSTSNDTQLIKIDNDLIINLTLGFWLIFSDMGKPEDYGYFRSINSAFPASITQVPYNDRPYYLVDNTSKLVKSTVKLQLTKGTYTKELIAKVLTDQMAKTGALSYNKHIPFNSTFIGIDCSELNQYFLVQEGFVQSYMGTSILDAGKLQYSGVYLLPSEFIIGTSQPSIVFEDGTFKMSLYQPIVRSAQWETAEIYDDSDPDPKNRYFEFRGEQSGAFLIGYDDNLTTDKSKYFFRDVLGFDIDSMLITYDDVNQNTPVFFYEKQSRALISQGLIYSSYVPCGVSGCLSVPVDASFIPNNYIYYPPEMISKVNSDVVGGHYLLRLINLNQNQMGAEDQSLGVIAFLGRQYTNENTITCYSDSSSDYTHYGVPMALDNIHVMILDPYTLKTANENFTGDTYFYLELKRRINI